MLDKDCKTAPFNGKGHLQSQLDNIATHLIIKKVRTFGSTKPTDGKNDKDGRQAAKLASWEDNNQLVYTLM